MTKVIIAAAFAALTCVPCIAQNAEPTGASAIVTVKFDAPVDDVFSLFDPINRSKWDQDWEIEIVSPAGETITKKGFRFRRLSETDRVWTIVELDRKMRFIELSYTKPETYDMTVQIQCEDNPRGATKVTITYTGFGLTEMIRTVLTRQLQHQIENRPHEPGRGQPLGICDAQVRFRVARRSVRLNVDDAQRLDGRSRVQRRRDVHENRAVHPGRRVHD
jgi:hypothetical protein